MSAWSFRLGRFAGIELRVHITFLLLVLWFWLAGFSLGGEQAALREVAIMIAVFGCIVLHEFAHALTAKHFGIGTRQITLWPIGGVASLERIPESGREELLITLAGPATNLLIAALLVGLGADLWGGFADIENTDALSRIALANFVLAVFNLLPAFPMDGGRILRALLSMFMERLRATHIAVGIGQALAVVIGFLALLGNPILVLIAIFIFIGAAQEKSVEDIKAAIHGLPAASAMARSFKMLSPQASVNDAAALIIETEQKDFPMVDDRGVLLGVLTRDGIITALSKAGPDAHASDFVRKGIPEVSRNAPLELALEKLQSGEAPMVAVTDGAGHVIGMITPENIAEFFMLSAARRRKVG